MVLIGVLATVFVAIEFAIIFLHLLDIRAVVKCVHVQTNPQQAWTHIRYGRHGLRSYLTILENTFQV